MKKIIVLAYQISPIRGSEYSVAWNYVSEMSKDNELVVFYGASGDHMGDLELPKEALVKIPDSNFRLIGIKPNIFARLINLLNKSGLFTFSFYVAYRIWQWQVYNRVNLLIKNEQFDIMHFLNPIGYREPGYLWKIDLPYIWGPISGISNRPIQLIKKLTIIEKLFFIFRNMINTLQFKYNIRLKKAIQRTDLLLTATTENQKLIEEYYHKQSIYLPENAIINSSIINPLRTINLKQNDIIKILWIGRIDANKSLIILIEALSRINLGNYHLHVVGDGQKKNAMQKMSEKLQLQNMITWHGQIPRTDVFNILKSSHLHIITSLGEGNPTTIWEAMSCGIPTISLNHCGMKDVICEKCGLKIDIVSYDQVVDDLSKALLDLLNNPEKINLLSHGVNNCIDNFTWEKRRNLFNQFYNIAIENWKMKKVLV